MGQSLGCLQVDQSTVAVKEHFGKFDDVLEPGCHCVPWFLGYQSAGTLSLRVQQIDVRCETKTKVFISLISIILTIKNSVLFLNNHMGTISYLCANTHLFCFLECDKI